MPEPTLKGILVLIQDIKNNLSKLDKLEKLLNILSSKLRDIEDKLEEMDLEGDK